MITVTTTEKRTQTLFLVVVVIVFLCLLVALLIVILVVVRSHDTANEHKQQQHSSAEFKGISVTETNFGFMPDGRTVKRYTIRNLSGMMVSVITLGATVTSIKVPDRYGTTTDVVFGYDELSSYMRNNTPYFGSTVGRVANRIANATFTLDGVTYDLNKNDGDHHLHGGPNGWHKALWIAHVTDDGVMMTHVSPDADENYPGTVKTTVTFTLTSRNELLIHFEATTSGKATPINLTSHPYFNLAGEGSASLDGHVVTIFADSYLPVTSELIPTGVLEPVDKTVFDFRQPTDLYPRLSSGSEFDHNFVLRGPTGKKLAARVYHKDTGVTMQVYTNQPGMQFYTGNFLNNVMGKNGHTYERQSGFCMETQNFPNAINQANFPDCVLRVGTLYQHNCWYTFSTA